MDFYKGKEIGQRVNIAFLDKHYLPLPLASKAVHWDLTPRTPLRDLVLSREASADQTPFQREAIALGRVHSELPHEGSWLPVSTFITDILPSGDLQDDGDQSNKTVSWNDAWQLSYCEKGNFCRQKVSCILNQ